MLTLPTSIRVLLPHSQVEEMKLETYLAGAVTAEIGADAPLEALKAQAVASRTYVAAAQRHPEANADVCTAAHCQKWKRVDPVAAPEVFRALSETWGMIAVYEGQLISAFFFEHCDGHTRNAEEMHIPALGYLRGVDCPCGFLTLKGHGVGMCKRGAIMMARRGAAFDQILRHYYRGISIARTAPELPAAVEPAPSESTRLPVEPPAAPKPRTRARKAQSPIIESAESPKPQRRVTRRVPLRVSAEPVAPPPVIEITAVPASVALKRIPIVPAAEVEPVAQTETPPREPTLPVARKPAAPPPTEPSAPTRETSPVDTARIPRLELDLPRAAPAEPAAPMDESAPAISWRLVKPEPIEQAREASARVMESTSAPPVPVSADETPSMIGRRVHVDHLPGERMICGALPRAGLVVSIEDLHGNKAQVYSGSAPHYGEGGFEIVVAEDGKYLVTIGGQMIHVQVQGDTLFIHA